MTEARKKLSLRLDTQSPDEKETNAVALLTQAMEHHLCVRWAYNRTLMQAAPQVLYRRNDSLYLDAVVTERSGAKPTEHKLGSFRVTGLNNIVLTTEAFAPDRDIDVSDARYHEGIIIRASD